MSDPGRPAEVLTIMITDVEASTAFRQIRGDRVTDEILRLHQVIVRGQLRRYRGREHKFLGDGFLVDDTAATRRPAPIPGAGANTSPPTRSPSPSADPATGSPW